MSTKIKTICYAELTDSLLSNLQEREREVLQKRNGLANFPEATLEEIGELYNITRERVRQIEKEGLRKLLNLDYEKNKLPISDVQNQIEAYLLAHGGLMSENHLAEKLLAKQEADEEKALYFLMGHILGSKFSIVDDLEDYHTIWHVKTINLDEILKIGEALREFIAKQNSPIQLNDLHEKFQSHNLYEQINKASGDNQAIIEALLRLRNDLGRNILEQWGLADWSTIKPKRMTDKAYLIMLREKKPLHFKEVADLINAANFDSKKACPATVHNELILDDKYVLVGRGTYALSDWGYQEGTVADIIERILKDKGAIAKKELQDEVLKQRMVQKTTIALALMNKDKFARLEDGRYSLAK
ncbi:MAG: sigma factor-like helix-turn-helix DNA-binding protein [Patescibacteria group bacterium]|nr:sigma factor-like helix-turn-helix DNA-binding protein [Patescibacteria group bacterium]